jgi:hypothetical protein
MTDETREFLKQFKVSCRICGSESVEVELQEEKPVSAYFDCPACRCAPGIPWQNANTFLLGG